MNKRLKIILNIFFTFAISLFLISTTVFADDPEDYEGNDPGGVLTNCDNAINAYQFLCGSPLGSKGGGAAWYVYSTTSGDGPIYLRNSQIMDGDIDLDEILTNCSASNGYGWYAAYGWVSPLNGKNGFTSFRHYGPVKNDIGGTSVIGRANYNTYVARQYANALAERGYNAYNANDVERALKNGYSGFAITAATATALHNNTPIEPWVGYFCVPQNSTFEGDAQAHSADDRVNLDTDWQKTDKHVEEQTIKCAEEGCEVTFALAMRRTKGNHDPDYVIYRGSSRDSINQPTGHSLINTRTDYYEDVFNEIIMPDETHCYGIDFVSDTSAKTTGFTGVCVTAEPYSRFEGIASASDTTTDWQKEDKLVEKAIECDDEGCNITFELGLRRTKGRETTKYLFQKGDRAAGADMRNITEELTSPSDGSEVKETFNERMEPGQTICYAIKFKPFEEKPDVWATETACITIVEKSISYINCFGNTITKENFTDADFLNIYIKKRTSDSWTDIVYTKPGDNLYYCSDYNPSIYQGSAGYRFREYATASNGSSAKPLGIALGLTNRTITERSIGAKGDATNPLNQEASFDASSTITVFRGNYAAGNRTPHKQEYQFAAPSPVRTITQNEVGRDIADRISTLDNTPTSTATTSGDVASISTETKTSTVHAYVPYNFSNIVETKSRHMGGIVYAGGSESVGYLVETKAKYNEATGGTYATRVENASVKITIYSSDYAPGHPKHSKNTSRKWGTIEKNGVTLNPDGNVSGSELSSESDSTSDGGYFNITIPDVPAGTYVCAISSVYPSDSGAPTNWQDPNGNYEWSDSNAVCFIVAKKPSLQVWGGNLYSSTNISTSTHTKLHLANNDESEYHLTSSSYTNSFTFGSWGELGVISNGTVTGMASGAALGYLWGDPTGKECSRVPLSFANATISPLRLADCTPTTGGLNKASLNNSDLDKNNLISKFIYEKDNKNSNYFNEEFNYFPNDPSSEVKRDNNVYYYKKIGNLAVGSGMSDERTDDEAIYVPKATTQIIHVANDSDDSNSGIITIRNDIKYEASTTTSDGVGLYTNFSTVPKLIIYAERRIDIACNVAEINAVLIAPRVTTCIDGELSAGAFASSGVRYDTEKCGLTAANLATNTEITTEEKNAYNDVRNILDTGDGIHNVICDLPGINNQKAQLKITGSVITNRLVANRSYGAGAGINSGVPAEILNFDSTLYRLEVNTGNTVSADKVEADTDLTTTYFRELPPRY